MKVYRNSNMHWEYDQQNKSEDKESGDTQCIIKFEDKKITIKYDLDSEPQEYSGFTADAINYRVFMSDNINNGYLQISECKTFLEGRFTEDKGNGDWFIELLE